MRKAPLSVLPTARAEFCINREASTQFPDLFAHTSFGRTIVGGPLRERPQYRGDTSSDGTKLGLPEAARAANVWEYF